MKNFHFYIEKPAYNRFIMLRFFKDIPMYRRHIYISILYVYVRTTPLIGRVYFVKKNMNYIIIIIKLINKRKTFIVCEEEERMKVRRESSIKGKT